MPLIEDVKAIEIIDSRGNPTIEVEIYLENDCPYLIDIDSPQDLKLANLLVKNGELKV